MKTTNIKPPRSDFFCKEERLTLRNQEPKTHQETLDTKSSIPKHARK